MKYILTIVLLAITLPHTSLQADKEFSFMNINHVIIPAAGLGTRFLPLTKASAKEMVTLFDKPAIHYIAQECVDAGMNNICIVTSNDKPEIERYFSPNIQLDTLLKKNKKEHYTAPINDLINRAQFTYVIQEQPLGLGHAIQTARSTIGNDFFGIILPDDIIFSEVPAIAQLAAVARKYGASVIGVQEIPHDKISAYGVVIPTKQLEEGVFEISGVVEKPKAEDAPSNLAIVGRYVFSPALFDALDQVKPSLNGECLLTDAFDIMINQGEKVLVYVIKGRRHDTGQPHGWLDAVLDIALHNEQYAQQVKNAASKS